MFGVNFLYILSSGSISSWDFDCSFSSAISLKAVNIFSENFSLLFTNSAELVNSNEKFSENILTALREIAEEKEQSKSQEDILPEESIYKKFTPNKDTNLFSKWHEASWSDKLRLLDKFEDERLVGFGKKIIFQEAPHVLPESILKQVKRDIAKRILSDKKEKWWTCKEFYFECDNLRDKFTNENDEKNLKFLDQLNNFVMSIEKKYQNV